jgi:hypothetical protein
MKNKTFVEKVAEVMYKNIKYFYKYDVGVTVEGYSHSAAEIAKMVEEVLPEETKEEEHIDICYNDVYVQGWNDCLAEIRRRLKGGV